MKFRFCGDADCPDWVLVEINTLSKVSSVKLKVLAQLVAKGLTNPPIDVEKAQKLFSESKLDAEVDLKACIACLSYILSSTTRFSCDSNALQSELQQLGLPREHSTSIKKIVDEHITNLTKKFGDMSLCVNALENFDMRLDQDLGFVLLDLTVNGKTNTVTLTPHTADVLLEDLKEVRKKMVELKDV
ncbi:unnamed protein product [Phaedon cochleariae]|uniref:COMM domain-containing protein 4 n=1 Tax=Phaedon cochleariae TaxID=80249 RepID=A0A9P0DVF2_PHACE|nr:unnamed protein product [Phaedon cochleariae]